MLNFGNKEFRNLQEQVLQNAKDIATLKGRENLQIVIVEELPEEGNPNYIYLVPNEDGEESNVYEEYIWLADSEEYEKIGSVDIDLTNYATLDTDQTITGKKTFNNDVYVSNPNAVTSKEIYFINNTSSPRLRSNGYVLELNANWCPRSNNSYNLGNSSSTWKDLYLAGTIYYDTTSYIQWNATAIVLKNGNNSITINQGGTIFGDTVTSRQITPYTNNTYSLGNSSRAFKDLYLTGNISDGVNSVTVANISSKVTSTYASGTFDANGEDTIDISGGEPEGLFIFTYGNCQCSIRLTATMVQNADLTPICVSCPMIYNSNPTSGWLKISRSSDTLTISVVDGTNHVDSGYAWTLVKTGLI